MNKDRILSTVPVIGAVLAFASSAFAADPIGDKITQVGPVISWVPALAVLGVLTAGLMLVSGSERAKVDAFRAGIGVGIAVMAQQIALWLS